ncbi:hypothetical protein [Sulfurimonas sp.]|uniref:hypothetical protein n=1 Tax=Sulfurimonas sp. TaxID=2022749 RepID=UPI0026124367|nr:hypothetical protein [Sulfurimonas sp.]MDD3856003.1 hypothetical protein [Sulfurimonas sp.]
MSSDIELNVYLYGNCFKFCIGGKFVEFKNIIKTLKDLSSLDKMDICTFKNPLYTFIIKIKDDGSSASGFALELTLTMVNTKSITPSNPIKITEIKNKENYLINNNAKEISCNDILDVLISLISIDTPVIASEVNRMSTEERKAEMDRMLERGEDKVVDDDRVVG